MVDIGPPLCKSRAPDAGSGMVLCPDACGRMIAVEPAWLQGGELNRCVDPRLGVKVLSYDLLTGHEKAEVDRHLQACAACSDLVQQTFGDEGALRELEWRAFKLSQRQRVAPHAWIARRLADLWLPLLGVVVGVVVLGVYLARRAPEPEQVGVMRLAALRTAVLDSLASEPLPRISPAPTSLVIQLDRDAIALVYESGAGVLRRLVPGADGAIPELQAGRTHELALPAVAAPGGAILLVLAPAAAPRVADDWDVAVMERVGAPSGAAAGRRGWPGHVEPTLRWLK